MRGGRLKIILFQHICFEKMVLIKIQTIHTEYKILPCVCVRTCTHVYVSYTYHVTLRETLNILQTPVNNVNCLAVTEC